MAPGATNTRETAPAIFRDREAARFRELLALAFWMRRAELVSLRSQFHPASSAELVAVPRGLVFQIPPSNVDTIFVYSWLLAVLAGNRNCIRMSSRRTPPSEILLRLLRKGLERADQHLRQDTIVVSYGHDPEISEALSRVSDVRVIWGGDHTVGLVHRVPLSHWIHSRTTLVTTPAAVFFLEPELSDLVPFLAPKDQTLTYFGFDTAELRRFAISLGDHGDRPDGTYRAGLAV